MKIFIKMFFILSMISFMSCDGKKAYKNISTQDSTMTFANNSRETDNEIINVNYNINLNNAKDSTVFNNEYYKVIIVPHEESVGDLIGIYNKKTGKSFSIDDEASYFVNVVDSFLIVDNGTGASSRVLSIYNINSIKSIFSIVYEGKFDIKDKKIFLKRAVELTDSTKRPECSDELKEVGYGLGYVENQIIDLTSQKLLKTGKFECWYFE